MRRRPTSLIEDCRLPRRPESFHARRLVDTLRCERYPIAASRIACPGQRNAADADATSWTEAVNRDAPERLNLHIRVQFGIGHHMQPRHRSRDEAANRRTDRR